MKTKNVAKAKYLILRPAGYPMKASYQEYPEISEYRVFEFYAKEQWQGIRVKKGDYLFDSRMFPDFAFLVVDVEPPNSEICSTTKIIVDVREEQVILPKTRSVRMSDIIGQERAKQQCRIIKKYLEDPERFGEWAPKNILFYGPPGTGKTMMAKALASESNSPIMLIKGTTLIGEHVGEGAQRIHSLYEKAKNLAPCIVFIDEIDAIGIDRRYQDLRGDVSEIVNALLTEMDGIDEREGVCTIGSTNRIELLDEAVRSRFEEEVEFTLPNEKERAEILRLYLRKSPVKISDDVDVEKIAKMTEDFSGRDLVEKVLKKAIHEAIIEDSELKMEHLLNAVKKIVNSKKGRDAPKQMFV